jgi:hypothetical protein
MLLEAILCATWILNNLPKKNTTKGDKKANYDGWRSRPSSIIWLIELQAHSESKSSSVTIVSVRC